MSNQLKQQSINALADLAKKIRSRQEEIESGLHKMHSTMGDLMALGLEQGRDLILAQSRLGKALKWSDWLSCHTSLTEDQAAKYKRLANEQINDPRQAIFAFLPPPDRNGADEPKRLPAAEWELAWGYFRKLGSCKVDAWPEAQVGIARKRIAEMAERFGGRVEW